MIPFQANNLCEDGASKVPPKASERKRKGAKYDTFDSEEQERIVRMMKKETERVCQGQVWHQAFLAFKPDQYRPILAKVIPKLVSF